MKTISSFKDFAESLLDFIRANFQESAAEFHSAETRDNFQKTSQIQNTSRANLPSGTRQHVDAQFNELALSLFALQFSAVEPYRKFCDARKISPQTIRDWKEIPAMPTRAFKEFEMSSLKPEERTHVFHSSGTTEQIPSRHFHNADSLAIYETSLLPWFERNFFTNWGDDDSVGTPDALTLTLSPRRGNSDNALGQSDGSKSSPSLDKILPLPGGEGRGEGGRFFSEKPGMIFLTPPPALAPNSSLVHMFETIRVQLGSRDSLFTGKLDAQNAWALDIDQTLFALRKSMCANRPIAILGTAFSFVHLLDHFAENNIRYRLAEGSRVMETGGYKGRSRTMPKTELHALITKHLGIPASQIVCEYGMSELSSQAYDQPIQNSRAFHFPPWARVQIISPENGKEVADGETGLVRIFDLANVFSVLAIQTEDLGIRRDDGFELIGRAQLAEPRGCSLMANG